MVRKRRIDIGERADGEVAGEAGVEAALLPGSRFANSRATKLAIGRALAH